MDAHALLRSQGWRGTGHTLHPTADSTGLSRPLLVSQKQNNLGIGKKTHKTSDLWWMNAFDTTLKGLDTSKEGKVVQTVTSGGLDMVAKGGARFVGTAAGLYASFVRGECLSGTITPEESGDPPGAKRRKQEEAGKDTKENRRARKAAKRSLKVPESAMEKVPPAEDAEDRTAQQLETKKERKERKRQRKQLSQAERDVEGTTSEGVKRKKRRKERSSLVNL